MKKKVISKKQASEFVRIASDFAEYMNGETESCSKKAYAIVAIEESEKIGDGCCIISISGNSKLVEVGIAEMLLQDKNILKNVIARIAAERLMNIIEE